jgi:hypothetical protein
MGVSAASSGGSVAKTQIVRDRIKVMPVILCVVIV